MYTHFLICYDIPNTPKRTKFAEMLKDLGLVALQKSVFYGVLKPEEFKKSIGYENFEYSEPDSYGFI